MSLKVFYLKIKSCLIRISVNSLLWELLNMGLIKYLDCRVQCLKKMYFRMLLIKWNRLIIDQIRVKRY